MNKLIGIALIFWSMQAFAGSITARLSSTQVEIGEQFTLSLEIEGRVDREPEIPSLDGIQIFSAGQSTSVSIINGDYSKTTSYNYQLMAEREGSFTIPSIQMEIDGKVESATPISFRVAKGLSGAAAAEQGAPAFVERSFSNISPYVGEPVVESIEIYNRVRVEGMSSTGKTSPDFRYFDLEDENVSQKVINGEQYRVVKVNRVLVPNSSGLKTIPPVQITAVMIEQDRRRSRSPFPDMFGSSFGRRVNKLLQTESASLDVKELPTSPYKNFQGVVGEFSIDGDISAREIKVGDTVTLTISISGQGLLDSLVGLDLQYEGVKIYPDKPSGEQQVNGEGIYAKKVFKFALVPTRSGTFDLGTVEVPVFNPKKASYELLSINLKTFEATGSAESSTVMSAKAGEQVLSQKNTVKKLNTDILDIHRDYDVSKSHLLTAAEVYRFLVFTFLPLLGIGGVFYRRRRGLGVNSAKAKRTQAYKQFKEVMENGVGDGDNLQGAYVNLSLHYKTYLGDRFGFQGNAMTSKELADSLHSLKCNEEFVSQSKKMIEEVEGVIYSGKTVSKELLASKQSEFLELARKAEKQ